MTITEVPTGNLPPGGVSHPKSRECDLDGSDQFWYSHKGLPFPSVAENIQEELEDYRSKEDDIKRMKHEMGVDGEGGDLAIGLISDNTQVRMRSCLLSHVVFKHYIVLSAPDICGELIACTIGEEEAD